MRAAFLAGGAAVCLAVGLAVSGWQVSSAISDAPIQGAAVTLPGATVVKTHILRKIVRGRVVTLRSGVRVIRVPLVVIHNLRCHPTPRHQCVRRVIVPAHTVPLRAAALAGPVAVARPLIPITVTETVTDTVTQPAVTVTDTQTQTTTDTSTVLVTVTVTSPLPPEGQP